MMPDSLPKQVDELRKLLESRLRVHGRTLDHQLRKAGRRLPRHIHRDGHYLAQAAMLVQNPKLAAMVDTAKAERAYQNVAAHLRTIDPRDRLKGRVLGILGGLAFGFLVVGAVVVWFLVEKGLV